MSRLSSKGVVVLLALLGAGGLLVSGFRPWVTGAVDDAVLGATRISATGAEVAPGLSAVALSIAAAAIAAASSTATSMAVWPSFTMKGMPPARVLTTGRPLASASSTALGMLSTRLALSMRCASR